MTVGDVIREWRAKRRVSQLELSHRLGVSARHISFVENNRANASRGLLLRLGEQLEMPLRARNELLLRAGYAPAFSEQTLDTADMRSVRAAVDAILTGHEPFPAIAVDSNWQLIAGNRCCAVLLDGVAPHLMRPPINVMRLCLHPDGLAKRLRNLSQIRASVLDRVHRRAVLTGCPATAELHRELLSYGGPEPVLDPRGQQLYLPIELTDTEGTDLTLIGMITTFGTPLDVTVADLSIESFFPADSVTAKALHTRAVESGQQIDQLLTTHPALAQYVTANPT